MKVHRKYLISLVGLFFCFMLGIMAQDGAAIFKANCGACHKLGRRLVGPDLLGVTDKRNEEWLLKFIKSSQSMITAGDPDAVAIFNEFNELLMTDNLDMSVADIKTVLAFIKEETDKAGPAVGNTADIIVYEYSEEDIEAGLRLYSGENRFNENGPSCLSCHHINNNELISGGLIAKDLTNVYQRMGHVGLAGILGAPPFPAMATAYKNSALDSVEIFQLTAFLKHANEVSPDQEVKSGDNFFILGGGGGLLVLLIIISLLWHKRLGAPVKHEIFARQTKSV